MAATSVGQIAVDLVVNKNQFSRQMNGLENTAKSAASKIGKALGIGLSVAGVVAFAKSCLDAGSKLNAMSAMADQAFKTMSDDVKAWAKTTSTSVGLSERMALQYASTMGSMARAFGFTEEQAVGMSTTLAELSGDVASYFAITQDEAYSKLQSVFTGETESLKSLGIVMSQTALDQFALQNGFGKTTAKMSEQEKVLLRYQFILKQTELAEGDFARSSARQSWGNQMRVLKLQIEDFKAAIGQGLINVLTPVLVLINKLVAGLVKLAQAFKGFTELITGRKSQTGKGLADLSDTASDASIGLADASGAADGLADSTSGIGAAAKQAAKEMRDLMGFDQINKLSEAPDSGSYGGGGSGSGGGIGSIGAMDFGKLAKEDEAGIKLNKTLEKLINRAKELAGIFKEGMIAGFGDQSLEPLQEKANNIAKTVKEIFSNEQVQESANSFLDTFAYSMGQRVGALASVGVTIATNVVGGADKYLEQNKGRIQSFMVDIFDVSAEISAMEGDYAQAFANIFSAFSSEKGQQVTANIIGIFANAGMGIARIGLRIRRDVTNIFTKPVIDNQEKLKEALEGVLSILESVTSAAKELVDGTVDKALEVYDEHLKPMFDSIAEGLSSIVGTLTDAYTEHIQPVLQALAEKLSPFVEEYVQPMVDAFMEFIGKLADLFTVIWENILVPFINWFIENIMPVLGPILEAVGNAFLLFGKIIAKVIEGVFQVLGGLIDFLTAVFQGDWDAAWEAIKGIFSDIWETIKSIGETIWNDMFGDIDITMDDIFGAIDEGLGKIEEVWGSVWDTIESVVSGAWEGIRTVINSILGGIETMVNNVIAGINSLATALNSLQIDVPAGVPIVGGLRLGFALPTWSYISLPRLARGGYVGPNTPQLAMIGDNRTEGEIVSPESKLLEMARVAAAGGNSEVIDLLRQILAYIKDKDPVALDPESIRKYFIKETNKNTKAGRPELVY